MLTSGPSHEPTPGSDSAQMLRSSEAARLLGITPMRLRDWESRFGFPLGRRVSKSTRQFSAVEILALRDALAESHSVPRAIDDARMSTSAGPAGLTPLMLRLAH